MKAITTSAALLAASLCLSSCGGALLSGDTTSTQTQQTAATAGATILNSLLGSLLSTTLTEQSIIGTWHYQQPEVRFESENLLAKAGGEVAAAEIEAKVANYLAGIGITKGVTTFVFNEDKTFSIQNSTKQLYSGTYTFNTDSHELVMTGALGLSTLKATVGMDGTNLCLLFEASKLLTMTNTVASILGKSNATAASVATVLGSNYKGMKVGFAIGK